MPGPTEVLNDDLKTLREDLHKFQVEITADVRELSTQVSGILTAIKLLAVLALSSLVASVWLGASLTTRVSALEIRFDKFEAKIESRFDRLEASIAQVLAQTKPVPKP